VNETGTSLDSEISLPCFSSQITSDMLGTPSNSSELEVVVLDDDLIRSVFL